MDRRILALDQASQVSGWAYFENSQLKDYGKIIADSIDLGERLAYIRKQVQDLIYKYNINELVIEDIQLQQGVGGNVKTFKVLAEVFGVIFELAYEEKVPCTAILASVWKSKLGIKGRARAEQKRAAQDYILNTYGIKAIQDICDAICIGTSYIQESENEINWE